MRLAKLRTATTRPYLSTINSKFYAEHRDARSDEPHRRVIMEWEVTRSAEKVREPGAGGCNHLDARGRALGDGGSVKFAARLAVI